MVTLPMPWVTYCGGLHTATGCRAWFCLQQQQIPTDAARAWHWQWSSLLYKLATAGSYAAHSEMLRTGKGRRKWTKSAQRDKPLDGSTGEAPSKISRWNSLPLLRKLPTNLGGYFFMPHGRTVYVHKWSRTHARTPNFRWILKLSTPLEKCCTTHQEHGAILSAAAMAHSTRNRVASVG